VLPEKARHSLDEQLRENEQTRNIILRTLRRLTNHIETGGWKNQQAGSQANIGFQ